ncbi:MAG: carbamoyltransferase HypF [Bacillota bacterium]|jgi:hydrogenase maturation protein HypF
MDRTARIKENVAGSGQILDRPLRATEPPAVVARKLHLAGVVQGVGFRPLVYRLAEKHQLAGWVLNSSEGLEVWVEGEPSRVAAFCQEVLNRPPRLARILQQEVTQEAAQGYQGFTIRHSLAKKSKEVLISPDVATCADCYREIMDPADPRYQYPFTNCTNCGPRYTIIQDVPYDRRNTTMRQFLMCSRCQAEYANPGHRRFHAQPNACPDCGPSLQLLDQAGRKVDLSSVVAESISRVDPAVRTDRRPALAIVNAYSGDPAHQTTNFQLLMQEARRLLRAGYILAIKGLGGFHLACDALNPDAVRLLRQRKRREYKPFAVMARDLDTAREFCQISAAEEQLLTEPAGPIVILNINENEIQQPRLPLTYLTPGLNTLGLMLPYTPLHHLMFEEGLELLVMTSANLSDDPLVTDNQEAITRLEKIADYFLVHNRDIQNRCDDSLVRIIGGRKQFSRRARGYVPFPVVLVEEGPSVLGVGGELKNTFCLTRKHEAYLSQHLGDLNHWGNYQQFLEAIPRLEKMLEVVPKAIAFDLHPDYAASRYARGREDLIRVGIQHHHAHLASCLAENQAKGPVLGVICDGTGYGTDGTFWGFEFLAGDYRGFSRLASLRPMPLPGGEASIRRPVRMALTYLHQLLGPEAVWDWVHRFAPPISDEEVAILLQQLARGFNTWTTSSCGRLFDAVAALLGVCPVVGYEGQAAVELETLATQAARMRKPSLAGKTGFEMAQSKSQSQTEENEEIQDFLTGVKPYPFPLVSISRDIAESGCSFANRETPLVIWPNCRGRIETPGSQSNSAGFGSGFKVNSDSEGAFSQKTYSVPYRLDPLPLWTALLTDLQAGVDRGVIALRFHQAMVEGITQACQRIGTETGISRVALSGGVFHNRLLLAGLLTQLPARGLEVLTHQLVPPNDGGLSLGQAVIAQEVLRDRGTG